MRKTKRKSGMGGIHDDELRFRLPEADKRRFIDACKVGRPAVPSGILREMANAYADYVAITGRQPESVRELFGVGEKH